MQPLYKFLGIILLSIAIFSGCNENTSESSPVSSDPGSLLKGSGPSATGQGKMVGTNRTFSFNAVTHRDGSVSGQGQLNSHLGAKIHFSIDCLYVEGNVATMSGTVTNSEAFQEYVGGPCWFRVKDNGEGSNAQPDEITFFIFCGPDETDTPCTTLTCDVDHESDAGGLQPIENGNIQVKQ